jgi:hypothetical protein
LCDALNRIARGCERPQQERRAGSLCEAWTAELSNSQRGEAERER